MVQYFPFETENLPEKNDFILLDTSFIYELWGKSDNQTRKTECINFTNELAKKGVYMVASVQSFIELRVLVERDIIGNGQKGKVKLENSPGLMSIVEIKLNEIESALMSNANFYPEVIGELNGTSLREIDEYRYLHNLRYGDAAHLFVMKSNEISNFATLDGDFSKVNDASLRVFVDSLCYKNTTSQLIKPNTASST